MGLTNRCVRAANPTLQVLIRLPGDDSLSPGAIREHVYRENIAIRPRNNSGDGGSPTRPFMGCPSGLNANARVSSNATSIGCVANWLGVMIRAYPSRIAIAPNRPPNRLPPRPLCRFQSSQTLRCRSPKSPPSRSCFRSAPWSEAHKRCTRRRFALTLCTPQSSTVSHGWTQSL